MIETRDAMLDVSPSNDDVQPKCLRSGSRHPELATVIKFINDEVRKLRSLTRMSTKQRKSFSTDLALVGLAAR